MNKQEYDATRYKLNKEKLKAQTAAYAKANPHVTCKKTKKWRAANPGKNKALKAKCRAAKLQRTPKWLTPLQLDQIEIFYDAATKLTKEFGMPMEVDHIVPLQGKLVSGLHVPWNLQVLSKTENARKRNTCA